MVMSLDDKTRVCYDKLHMLSEADPGPVYTILFSGCRTTLNTVQCTLYSVDCTLYTVHCTLYAEHLKLYTV